MIITAKADKSVVMSRKIVGYYGENNIDLIELVLEGINLNVKWYLLFAGRMIPFNDLELIIDKRITASRGKFECYIIGTDAKGGQPISAGSQLYVSDVFELEVR